MITATPFNIADYTEFKRKMLNWAAQFNIFCLLDNQHYQFEHPAFDCLLAVGIKSSITLQAGNNALDQLKTFHLDHPGWLFGHIAYDVKNDIETLQSFNADSVGFPDVHFFNPEIVLRLQHQQLWIESELNAAEIFNDINACASELPTVAQQAGTVKSRFNQQEYIDAVKTLQQHIHRGDCYEINFCQEFYVDGVNMSPLNIYDKLTRHSPNPFAALYRLNNRYCICASPERYFKKTGNLVVSQPIKGTAPRNTGNPVADQLNKAQLLQSEKERSENVMVVDLVRNDLSKICIQGTVQVDELFGIYSFPQVHQMISTISGQVTDDTTWVDIVGATFPMGSMTGAPKRKVMELIEQYERTRRGLFSGSIGYVAPNGNADFNVIIRSIFYNAATQYLSFQAGSAITSYSNAALEYEECLLKTSAIRQALQLQ